MDKYQEFKENHDLAPFGRKTPDGYVPGGVAGFIVEECKVLCYECGIEHKDVKKHDENTDIHSYSYNYIGCMNEWDYPGATCENCLKTLDTNIIFYD